MLRLFGSISNSTAFLIGSRPAAALPFERIKAAAALAVKNVRLFMSVL
jgi:hypothetical protein